jgi:hypothetical protein
MFKEPDSRPRRRYVLKGNRVYEIKTEYFIIKLPQKPPHASEGSRKEKDINLEIDVSKLQENGLDVIVCGNISNVYELRKESSLLTKKIKNVLSYGFNAAGPVVIGYIAGKYFDHEYLGAGIGAFLGVFSGIPATEGQIKEEENNSKTRRSCPRRILRHLKKCRI